MCRNIPKDMGAQNMDNNKLDFFCFCHGRTQCNIGGVCFAWLGAPGEWRFFFKDSWNLLKWANFAKLEHLTM